MKVDTISMDSNTLIFGRDETKGIVGMEVEGTQAFYWIQQPDGSVVKETRPNRYWVLANENLNGRARKLDGNLFYNWGHQFETKQDFYSFKSYNKMYDTYSVSDPREAHMMRWGSTFFKGLKHNEVSVLAFDIETTGLKHDDTSKVLLISNTHRDTKGNVQRRLFAYDEYESPKEMLDAWCKWVVELDPAIMCGHNVVMYDLPYLHYIAKCNNTELYLGREGKAIKFNTYSSKFRKDASQFYDYKKTYIWGREIVDTFFVSIQHDIGRKYTSYGLKSIIAEEGLEVEGRVFYDASLIRHNYKDPKQWSLIKEYANFDADDALSLWNLMGPTKFYWTQSVPKSLQEVISSATGSQINSMMVRAYLQESHSLPQTSKATAYEGATSLGIAGIYSQAFKVDILSAYPSTILVYKIYDSMKDPRANFLKIVEYFFHKRKEYKRIARETGDQYYKDMDATTKLALNSMYGTLGTNGLLFNFPEGAALITKHCRDYIEKAIMWATSKPVTYWRELNDNANA